MTEKVATAVAKLKELISSYPDTHNRPDINGVQTILQDLKSSDLPALYEALAQVASSSLGEVRFDGLGEVMSATQNDRMFGHQTSQGMEEYYENEARVEARSRTLEPRVIDSIVELVKLVEAGATL